MGESELTPLTTRHEVLSHAGADDGFARWELPEQAAGWALGTTVANLRSTHSRGVLLTVWGPDVAEMVLTLVTQRPSGIEVVLRGPDSPGTGRTTDQAGGGRQARDGSERWSLGLTVPRDRVDQVRRVVDLRISGEWDWLVTTTAPAMPRIDTDDPLTLTELDDTADAAEISALAARENPRFEGYPGQGRSRCWLGLRDRAGTLVGCGAIHETPGGSPHLAGILVAQEHRGQGHGRVLTAALTRRAVHEEGVCTLGMYADNVVARGLYHSLGYRTDKEWASGVALPLRPTITSRRGE